MPNKIFNTRIRNKRDTAANWETVASTFQPLDGEMIIVYTADGATRFKVGRYDSVKGRLLYYNELPFTDESLGNKIYTQNEEPVDAADGALWVDLDEISSSPSIIPRPTSADNGTYLGCENGAATWKPVDASGGGGDVSLGLTAASVGQTIKVKAVDENGKPTEWEPADLISGVEKIVFNETVIASGTIPEGLEAWKSFFDGVITVAELKKWKKFLLVVVAGTSTNIQINLNNFAIFSSGNSKYHYVEFEWKDSEKTVLDIRTITEDAGIAIRDDTGYYAKPGVYLPTQMSSTSFRTSINKRLIDESYRNFTLKLIVNTAQTAEGAWTLHGLLQ